MKKAGRKILITGAGGMLGQELVRVFKKDRNYSVFAWDKENLDITRENEVKDKIGKLRPEFILNAAAYNAVDKAEEPKEYKIAKRLNGDAPGYLAKVAKKISAALVHYSSDYVFSGVPEIPEPEGCAHVCSSCALHEAYQPPIGFDENAKPNPVNKYGRTKLLGEKEVKKNGKKYYIIRLAALFGKPALSKGSKRGFFAGMLEGGKKGEIKKIVDEETTSFTYAPDLAKKTKEIIESKKPFGIYHVTNSGYDTWYGAAKKLYKQAKIKTKIIPVPRSEFPRPAKTPHYSVLLNTKLNPLRSYKEALAEYLKSNK